MLPEESVVEKHSAMKVDCQDEQVGKGQSTQLTSSGATSKGDALKTVKADSGGIAKSTMQKLSLSDSFAIHTHTPMKA